MSAPAEVSDVAPPAAAPAAASPSRLWAELAALYVGVPLALAFVLPPDAIWAVVAAGTLIALAL
ncbi:MAG: thiamine pyrophosphate-binding protein, partial [Pseudomonadota bacterium]